MGAQNFNFVVKFRQNAGFLGPKFVLLEENFPGRKFLHGVNLGGDCLTCPMP